MTDLTWTFWRQKYGSLRENWQFSAPPPPNSMLGRMEALIDAMLNRCVMRFCKAHFLERRKISHFVKISFKTSTLNRGKWLKNKRSSREIDHCVIIHWRIREYVCVPKILVHRRIKAMINDDFESMSSVFIVFILK